MIRRRKLTAVGIVLFVVGQPISAQSKPPHVTKEDVRGSWLSQPAYLTVSDVSLERGLMELHRTSGVFIAFSPSLPGMSTRVSCSCEHVTVAEALRRVLRGLSLHFTEYSEQVLIEPAVPRYPAVSLTLASRVSDDGLRVVLEKPVAVQQGVVAGTVVDPRSQPIQGARIVVLGTASRAVSDAAGRFRIGNLSGVDVSLEVSRIGYRKRTEAVAVGDTAVRVVLLESAINLNALVVTGTATPLEKRAIGNSVSLIDAAQITAVAPVRNVADLLNGRASSIVLTPVTGVVGAGPQMHIRGRGSISLSAEPLIYIDGVRVNNDVATGPLINASEPNISRLGDLNPEEIESIEVIKGPAAATLYGTEASNGVIQIITKRGRPSDQPTLEVSVRQGANWFMDAADRIGPNFGQDPATGAVIEQDLVGQERAAGRPLFRTGHVQTYDLSLNGGSNLVRYFIATGFDREEGIEPTNDFRRLSGRANLTVAPSEKLDVTVNFGIVRARRNLSLDRGLSLLFALQFGNPALQNTPTRGFLIAPPEFWWTAFDTFQDVDRYTAGIQMNHRPWSWLQQRLTVGVDQSAEDNQVVSQLQPDSIRQFLSGVDRNGRKIVTRRNRTVNTVDYAATATARLAEGVRSSTSIGGQYYRNFTESQFAEGRGFPAPGLTTVTAASQTFGGDDFIENTTIGLYVQQQFSLNDRIFLTGAIRADDNSAFGGQFEIVTYPKVSAAWVVSEEPFWKVGFVETLRLRGAYGQSGQQPDAFASLRTYRATTGAQGPAVSPLGLGNPELAPERGEEIELGFETELFGGRVGIDFTYYDQRTTDMILNRSPAPSSGFSGSQSFNAGEVANKGMELLLDAIAIESRPVRWSFALNLATNHNELVDLDPNDPSLTFIGGAVRHAEGYPLGGWWERRVVSATFDPATGRAENIMCDGGPGATPVDCSSADRVFIAQPTPTWEGGFTNTVTFFDRLTLHTQFDFKGGHFVRDVTNWARCGIFRLCEVNVRPELFDPIDVANAQLGLQTPWASKADYLKLREISLSYALPENWVGWFGARRASIAVAGRNLHTWTGFTGLDPETNASTTIRGFNYYEQTSTPQLASFITTVRLTW